MCAAALLCKETHKMDVPLSWQLAKLAISIGIVLGLSLVAERVSTRIAGLLAGYPLGTAIALFFIGLEIAPAFAAESAVFSLAGFTATMALGCGYLLCGRRDGLRGVLGGTIGALVAWWLASLILTRFEFDRFSEIGRASCRERVWVSGVEAWVEERRAGEEKI